MNLTVPVHIDTRVIISEFVSPSEKKILSDSKNSIHSQNMARALARGLAREPKNFIHRIAFGNGGTFTDAVGNLVFNPPNDGREGSGGWSATLYNETYSEIIDESNVDFGNDPGSAGRFSGGSSPVDDPTGGGVTSYEAGDKSIVKISMYLNENEPNGQLTSSGGPMLEDDERCFFFDELGLYTEGLPGLATHGSSSIEIGNKISEDVTLLEANESYTMTISVDSIEYSGTVTTPAGGSGPSGEFTYGDLCEGINTGDWITAGDDFSQVLRVDITDRSGGTYPSIIESQTFGYLTFSSLTTGNSSVVSIECGIDSDDIFSALTSGVCDNANVNTVVGKPAGSQNDPNNPDNERERLLTHLIFSPILKHSNRAILIEYFLTISIPHTSDSQTTVISA